MTDPNAIAGLRSLKVPEKMNASKALKDFLISQTETDQSSAGIEQQLKANRQLMALLIGSHLEVVHALGALEEGVKKLAQSPE